MIPDNFHFMVFASNLTTNTCFHSDQILKYFYGTAIDFEDYHYKIAVITHNAKVKDIFISTLFWQLMSFWGLPQFNSCYYSKNATKLFDWKIRMQCNFNKTNEAENPVQMFICWPFLQSSSFILKILIVLHKYYVLNVKIIIKLW